MYTWGKMFKRDLIPKIKNQTDYYLKGKINWINKKI